MTNVQFGEVPWTTKFNKPKSDYKSNKDKYLKLVQGNNIMRVITKGQSYAVHTVKDNPDDTKDFGDRVMCSAAEGFCPVCATDNRAYTRIKLGVIDRVSQSTKLLDISTKTFSGIQNYTEDEDYGSPDRYDINIIMDQNAPPASYYTVVAKLPKPLSAADLAIKESFNMDELRATVAPPTAADVQERLDNIKKWKANKLAKANGTTQPAVSSNGSAAKSTRKPAEMPSLPAEDSFTDFFPAVTQS